LGASESSLSSRRNSSNIVNTVNDIETMYARCIRVNRDLVGLPV
jgi:hypothetical protein